MEKSEIMVLLVIAIMTIAVLAIIYVLYWNLELVGFLGAVMAGIVYLSES